MFRALLTPGLGMGAFAVGTSRRMRSAARPNSTVRIKPNQRPQHSCSRPLSAAGAHMRRLERSLMMTQQGLDAGSGCRESVEQNLAAWCWNLRVAVRALRAVQHWSRRQDNS